MNVLRQLEAGDIETVDEVFHRLYPVAFEAARSRLGSQRWMDCEEVAVDTLRDILEKGARAASDDGLRPLAAAIARNKATDRLRRAGAEKRGGGRVLSSEELSEQGAGESAGARAPHPLDALALDDLRDLLENLMEGVKKEYRVVLSDRYLSELTHKEIAEKRGIALGSVGVFIERGLDAMKLALRGTPRLKAELLDLIGDAGMVRALLPLLWAVQIGGVFFPHLARQLCIARRGDVQTPEKERPPELSDEDRLRLSSEHLPEAASLPAPSHRFLMGLAEARYPRQFAEWERRQAAYRESAVAADAARRAERVRSAARRIALLALVCGALASGAVVVCRWLLRR